MVDDGSRDLSADVADSFGFPVRVLRQRNRGAAVTRHVGVSAARGDLVAFLDADDVCHPKMLETMSDALAQNPTAIVAVGSPVASSRALKSNDVADSSPVASALALDDAFVTLIGQNFPIVAHMNLMTYRLHAIEQSARRGFYRAANDYDLQIRLALRGSFVCVASPTAWCRVLHSGLTATYGVERQVAYALCAAADALQASGRQVELAGAWRVRVQNDWPIAVAGAVCAADWVLLLRVLRIALTQSALWVGPRPVWWQVDRMIEQGDRKIVAPVRFAASVLRRCRDVVWPRTRASSGSAPANERLKTLVGRGPSQETLEVAPVE